MNMTNQDDEGIIDLRALASTPPRSGGPIVAPLFYSEPPPGVALDNDDDAEAPRRGSRAKTIGIIAASAFVVALAGTGLVLTLGRPKPGAVATPAPPPPPVAAAAAAPLPTASAATTAPEPAPIATAATTEDDTSASKKGKGKARAVVSGKTKAKPGDVSLTAAKPKAAKAADACNCHGDLQCNIRCSAGK